MSNFSKPLPAGMQTLSPHLVCADCAGALEFYKKAFGAIEEMRLPGPEGKLMHAAMRFGTSMLLLMDEFPDWNVKGPKMIGGSPVTIHVIVDDVDAAFDQAVAAGAEVVMPVADQFWGDRYGVLRDPWGHSWSLSTPSEKRLTPEEILENMKNMPSG